MELTNHEDAEEDRENNTSRKAGVVSDPPMGKTVRQCWVDGGPDAVDREEDEPGDEVRDNKADEAAVGHLGRDVRVLERLATVQKHVDPVVKNQNNLTGQEGRKERRPTKCTLNVHLPSFSVAWCSHPPRCFVKERHDRATEPATGDHLGENEKAAHGKNFGQSEMRTGPFV